MAVVALDTYEIVKELRAVGFDEAQAAALTGAVKRAQQIDLSELAIKADLSNFATKADLANLATKADLANFATKAELANFATKAELATEVDKLRHEVEKLRLQLEKSITDAKVETLRWFVGIVGFQIVAIAGLMTAILRFAQTGALPTP